MRTHLVAALAASALLAGCGGGGSGAAPVLPAPSASAAPLSPQDAAQSATDAAFSPVDTGEADAAVNNGSLGTSSSTRSIASVPFACRDRRTRTVTVNADNTVTVETKAYYDSACTEVERDAVAVLAVASGTQTVARTVTTFALTGAQLGVRKAQYALTGSKTNGSWTVTSAFYAGTSTSPLSQYSHAASLSANAYSASTGRIANNTAPAVNASFGHQGATSAALSSDGAGDTVYTGTHDGASFKGSLGGLTISSAAPFTVSGGTQIATSSLTGSVAFATDGSLVSVNLTGTIANGNALSVTSTTSASGVLTVTGTVTKGSTTVDTFTTDANGNGILTVTATGTQVPIVDWHVVWG